MTYPKEYGRFKRNIAVLKDYWLLLRRLKSYDEVVMQWGIASISIRLLYLILKYKCNNLTILVHDINELRGITKYAGMDYSKWDIRFSKIADKVILHSEPMKRFMVERGIKEEKIRILTAFDYLTDDLPRSERKKTKKIVFAGNLSKSVFLSEISKAGLKLTMNCYGKWVDNLGAGLEYKGSFTPDNVSVLDGSWGLVWDGETIDTCSGSMGEYQRYNAPHKLSLYIVAHLPVVIWKEAAMASYVMEKGLGICVSSLREVPAIIDAMTDDEYSDIVSNVKREAIVLRSGGHLKQCLEQ